MIVSEITLVALALHLSTGPSASDVSDYQSLTAENQAQVVQLISERDQLPARLQELIDAQAAQRAAEAEASARLGIGMSPSKKVEAPTNETSEAK